MFFNLYNHLVKSELDLSQLGVTRASSKEIPLKYDIKITIQKKKSSSDFIGMVDNQTAVDKELGYYLKKGVAFFEFFKGKEIRVTPLDTIDQDLIRVSLNYPIASLFYQRGFFLLHASAVKYRHRVFLFPGNSLSGKSSLAALLINQGGKLLTEDTAVMKFKKNKVLIYPSYPMLKISDEVKEAIKFPYSSDLIFNKEQNNRKGYLLNSDKFLNQESQIDYCIFPVWCRNKDRLFNPEKSISLFMLLQSSLNIYPLNKQKEKDLFKLNALFLKNVDTYLYERPKDLAFINQFLDKIDFLLENE